LDGINQGVFVEKVKDVLGLVGWDFFVEALDETCINFLAAELDGDALALFDEFVQFVGDPVGKGTPDRKGE
jgi:hypothetical protein